MNKPRPKLHLLFVICLATGLLAGCGALPAPVRVGPASLVFATQAQAKAQISTEDEWTRTIGPFHRQAVLNSPSPVSTERFRVLLSQAVTACPGADIARWTEVAKRLSTKISAAGLRLPREVFLVCTDGSDSAGTPYTRGSSIFLPQALKTGSYSDEEILAHELFHVSSRSQPALADDIYKVFGFQRTGDLVWPPEWDELRMANPDAPGNRHAIRLVEPQEVRYFMPVLVAKRTSLKPGEPFFAVIDVRLLEIEPGVEKSVPRRRSGELVWISAREAPWFLRALGQNTSYIFHPEEVAADNFAFHLSGRPLHSPELARQLLSLLSSARGN